MATQLASTRQPFSPLNSSRLQTLTSLKNRQNAISSLTPSSKRKAASFDAENSNEDGENIDPAAFLSPKRCKGADVKDGGCKPVNYFLTTSTSSPAAAAKLPPPRRAILPARSPANPRLEIGGAGVRKTPLSAPAGRSPTRKRAGILNRRKTGGGSSPFTRVDPPKFSSSALSSSSLGLGFSIDAALSGTIPGYASRAKEQERERELQQEQEREQRQMSSVPALWTDDKPRESWNFEIYEDTEEELATNLMEHGACTLEISSDEESAARERDLRGKENVPPEAEDGGDVSQTSSASPSSSTSADAATLAVQSAMKASTNRASRSGRMQDANAIVIDRCPLGDLPAEDFYAEGCDENTVVLADADADASALITPPADGSENDGSARTCSSDATASTFDFAAGAADKGKGKAIEIDLDALMAKGAESGAPGARLLEPLEKAEVGWSVWESGSAKGDGEEE